MKTKKTKTLKGMSLVECIVALAVMGIIGSIVVVGAGNVFTTRKNTERVLNNTAYETPFAEIKDNLDAAHIESPAAPTTIQIAGEDVKINVYAVFPQNDESSARFRYIEATPATTTSGGGGSGDGGGGGDGEPSVYDPEFELDD